MEYAKTKSHELDLTPKSGRQDFSAPFERLFCPLAVCLEWGGPSAAPPAPGPRVPEEPAVLGREIQRTVVRPPACTGSPQLGPAATTVCVCVEGGGGGHAFPSEEEEEEVY